MAEFPTYEEMAKEVAEKALDEFTYKDKTLREWIEIIVAQDLLAIEELEKLKAEINGFCKGYLCTPQPEAIADDINEHIINKRIAELKGENKEECTSDSCDKCDNRFNCTGYQLEWERINESEEEK